MASSSSSSNASYTSPLSQSNFSSLPVIAFRKKIVEKVMENRVTLIVGEAGCGIKKKNSVNRALSSSFFVVVVVVVLFVLISFLNSILRCMTSFDSPFDLH